MGGSSKKVTVGYKYYLGMHLVLCHGPVDKVTRLRCDSRNAWEGESTGGTITVNNEGLFGGESREGGVSGPIDLDFGGPAQNKNAYLQTQLGSDIPGFRGVLSAIFKQCYLGMNPYLKFWDFRVQRIHTRRDGLEQWYDEKAAVGGGIASYQSNWDYQTSGSLTVPPPAIPTSGWISGGKAPFGRAGSGFIPPIPINTYWAPNTALWTRRTINCTGLTPIVLRGLIENAAYIYFDDVLVGSYNPSNAQVSLPLNFSITIPRSTATKGSHTIVVYALDEATDFGAPDTTYLSFAVNASEDMNPAHIIRECLTDPDWGMGYPEADIDDTSFMSAADTLFEEEMGMSLLWDRQIPIEDFINEVVRHINATLYVDRSSGKFVLKLIRKDYIEDDLITLNESNIMSVKDYTRIDPGESINSVVVNYWDSATGETESVTADDLSLIQVNGVVSTTIQYPGFTNPTIAGKAAARDLRSLSSPLLSCTILANREASGLNIGDVFKFEWPDYHDGYVVMRVMQMALGNGKNNQVKLTVSEDIYSLPESSLIGDEGTDWEDPSQPPTASDYVAAVESPYYEVVQQVGQTTIDDLLGTNPDVGYLVATASRPGSAINAVMSVDAGAGYEDSSVVDFCPYGLVNADIDHIETSITLTGYGDLNEVVVGTHAYLGDEIVVVDAINTSTGEVIIGRGALDTTPKAHVSGTPILFWDYYLQSDGTEYVASDSLDVKIRPTTSQGTIDLADVVAENVVMDSRAIRPYPPGQFKLDGSYYPDLIASNSVTVTWVHRDRKQQTSGIILDHTDASVGPEAGTTYRLQLYNESLILESEVTGISTLSQVVDLSSLPTEIATIMLFSERDGYLSWQAAAHTFAFTLDMVFVALPLTYDEDDYDGTMTWTRQGSSPHVTPDGFEGNGWNARLKSTTIPAWLSPAAARLSIQASIQFSPLSVMNADGDTVLHLGTDAAGVVPNPKLAIRVLPDPDDARFSYLALQSFTSALQTMPLCRSGWHHRGNYPAQTFGGNQLRPQGILFLDVDTLLVMAHAENTDNVVHQIDLTTNTVTGSFSFGDPLVVGTHLAGMARRANGELWMAGYSNRVVRVNLAASLESGAAQIEQTITVSDMNGLGAIEFMTLGGAERLILAEYNNDNDDADLAIFDTSVLTGSTLSRTEASKVFNVGRRVQGICARSGQLALSRNRKWGGTTSATTLGWVEFYDVAGMFASLPSGSAVHAGANSAYLLRSELGASSLPEDMSVHPTTNDLWIVTEGWQGVGDWSGFNAIWSSPVDGSAVENHITATFDGLGTVSAKLNGRPASSAPWTPTTAVSAVSVGGPPSQGAEFVHGFFKGFVKNVRLQNKMIDATQYAETVVGTTFEPNTLTAYTITLTNPGAESGVTGWTNETGSLATRSANPNPYEGSAYFSGGSNAATRARQRIDLLSATGLTGGEVDAGGIWAKVRWHQASYTDQDPCRMGIRMLDSVPTEISTTYGHLDWVQYGTSGTIDNWQPLCLGVDIPIGTRNIDAVYDSTRTAGTNLDGYIDSISLTVYQQ